MTLIDEVRGADKAFKRTAVPAVYAEYKEFIATGQYPYIASVAEFIARKHGLDGYRAPNAPSTAMERFDHEAIHLLANATGDDTLVKLHHEIYLASGQYRVEEMEARAAELAAQGFRPITELEPVDGMRIELADGIVYRLRPTIGGGGDWCLLPPRKRTNGFSLGAMQRQHEAFVEATRTRQTQNSPHVRMYKEAA